MGVDDWSIQIYIYLYTSPNTHTSVYTHMYIHIHTHVQRGPPNTHTSTCLDRWCAGGEVLVLEVAVGGGGELDDGVLDGLDLRIGSVV